MMGAPLKNSSRKVYPRGIPSVILHQPICPRLRNLGQLHSYIFLRFRQGFCCPQHRLEGQEHPIMGCPIGYPLLHNTESPCTVLGVDWKQIVSPPDYFKKVISRSAFERLANSLNYNSYMVDGVVHGRVVCVFATVGKVCI